MNDVTMGYSNRLQKLSNSQLDRSTLRFMDTDRSAQFGLELKRLRRVRSTTAFGGNRDASLMPDKFVGRSKLDRKDEVDPNFDKRYYYEDWQLPRGLKPGQQVEVTLTSNQFDTYLYLADARTKRGKQLLYGADMVLSNIMEVVIPNSRLIFTVKPGTRYLLRASTTSPKETGKYTIRYRVYKSPSQTFNFFYGSGLVDAAAAVASAVGQSPFAHAGILGGDDWGRDLVNAPAAWAQGWTGQNVTVAVIDTGVDYTHSELQANIWSNAKEIPGNGIDDDQNGFVDDIRGWDFVSGNNEPIDTDGHGTHVAGTIAAARNGVDVTGVAPDAKIMPLRVIDDESSDAVYNNRLIQAIDYATQNGAKVINLSLRKGFRYDFELGAALQRAHQGGVAVVIASGNGREDEGALQPSELGYRAMLNNLGITVGAIDRNKAMALFSNPAGRTPSKFVVAPGVAVRSSIPGNQYASFDGTSMAAPHVAGAVALMLSANPNLTPTQIYSLLVQTANPKGVQVTP